MGKLCAVTTRPWHADLRSGGSKRAGGDKLEALVTSTAPVGHPALAMLMSGLRSWPVHTNKNYADNSRLVSHVPCPDLQAASPYHCWQLVACVLATWLPKLSPSNFTFAWGVSSCFICHQHFCCCYHGLLLLLLILVVWLPCCSEEY